MIKNIDRYIRTTNLNHAIFLYTKDQPISGINSINEDQKEFVFVKTDTLEELVWLYRYGDRDDERLMVQVHKYEQARRELLDRLND
jgi:hypothetical protein